VKFVSKIVELEADGAGRQVNFFRGPGHARGVHDREKQFELVDVHLPAPTSAHRAGLRRQFHTRRNAFYTADKWLRQIPARGNNEEGGARRSRICWLSARVYFVAASFRARIRTIHLRLLDFNLQKVDF
jgi:hypothetical protein